MKTIKIQKETHDQLLQIKGYYGYKTISETIDILISEYWYRNMPYENINIRKNKDDKDKK